MASLAGQCSPDESVTDTSIELSVSLICEIEIDGPHVVCCPICATSTTDLPKSTLLKTPVAGEDRNEPETSASRDTWSVRTLYPAAVSVTFPVQLSVTSRGMTASARNTLCPDDELWQARPARRDNTTTEPGYFILPLAQLSMAGHCSSIVELAEASDDPTGWLAATRIGV